MKYVYDVLLHLYPASRRAAFGCEMADVFGQAIGEARSRGLRVYCTFLWTEFSSLIAGAFSAWTDECALQAGKWATASFVFSIISGAVVTALFQGCIYVAQWGAIPRDRPVLSGIGHSPDEVAVTLLLASGCLLFVALFSAAFVWNMRTVRSRAKSKKV